MTLSETTDPIGLGGLFTRLAAQHPDRDAFVCGTTRLSWGEADRLSNQIARVLAARGVTPGSTVATVLSNQWGCEFWLVMAATWKLGAVPTPLSFRSPPRERAELYELSGAVVSVVESADMVEGPAIFVEDLLKAATNEVDGPHPDVATAPWKAVPSGGSTGRPKLIVDQTGGPIAPLAAELFQMRPGGREILASPLYHNGPLAWGAMQLFHGAGTVVVMERFDAESYLRLVEEEQVNWSFVVPTMLHRIFDLPDDVRARYDLSSLDVLLHSAAPCPAWLKRKAMDFFGPTRVFEYYGATEVAGSLIRGDEWLEHPGSVGRPITGFEWVIVDDDGNPLPTGEVGEIFTRVPGEPTFRYRGSKERIVDGMVSVGDLGRLDQDGYLYIADRRTDLILSGGANIYPAEVEAALLEHPGVLDCGVVGLPHPDWGQQVHAIVQPRDITSPPSDAELAAFCRERLASYKVPKSFEFIEELPRDPSGKLRRSKLRDDRVKS